MLVFFFYTFFFSFLSTLFMLQVHTFKTKANNHLHILLDLCVCVCFVNLIDQVDIDEMKDFFYLSFTIMQTSYRATFLPSFFFYSFIHVFIHSFILFIHSSAWLAHEYMDVLLLCWFQKERTYEQKGRTGEEVKSILYTQQRRRHTKTTHVGQKKEGEREREK